MPVRYPGEAQVTRFEPAREERASVRRHLLTPLLERLQQRIESARPADPLERLRIVRHGRPLGRHLTRDLEVELHGVGGRAYPESLVRVGRRAGERNRTGGQV